MSRVAPVSIVILMASGLAGLEAAERVVASEPPMGRMMPGERLLVDDGTCGPGRIKEVVGGDHVQVGGKGQIKRERRCVPRR